MREYSTDFPVVSYGRLVFIIQENSELRRNWWAVVTTYSYCKWRSQEMRVFLVLLAKVKAQEMKEVVTFCLDTSCFRTCPLGLWSCRFHWFFSTAKIKILTYTRFNLLQPLSKDNWRDIATSGRLSNNCKCVQSQQAQLMPSANQNLRKDAHCNNVTQYPTSREDNTSQVQCQNVSCAMDRKIDDNEVSYIPDFLLRTSTSFQALLCFQCP